MSFPLSILLIIYLAYLFLFFLFSFFSLYHLVRFGFKSFTAFFMTFLYVGLSAFILFLSWQYIAEINWQSPVEIFQNIGGNFPF